MFLFQADLNESIVGSDLPNESHNEVEEHGPLSVLEICPRGNNKLVIIIFPCS